MKHVLEADSILLDFNGRSILSDVYIKCETGKITGLLGRNGQGKSCLMKIIYGELKTENKSVRFNNNTLYEAFKRPDILLYLPQFNFIPPSFSLKRVLSDFDLEFYGFASMFPEYGSHYKTTVGSFSGGGRRLVELYVIIKAVSFFAMMDEPFTHISPLQVEKIKELLTEEKKKKGFLITDHMFRHIIDIQDNLYLLKDGKTYLTKTIDDIESLGYARL